MATGTIARPLESALLFRSMRHLYFRRLVLNRTLYGTPADHRLRLADLLDQKDAA